MSLIDCPECGKQISSEAVSCPGCGISIAKSSMGSFLSRQFFVISGIVLVAALAVFVVTPLIVYGPAKTAVKNRLKDPDSAQFSSMRKNIDGDVCGVVNSRNSMGGYGEATRFIVRDDGVEFKDSVRCSKAYDEYIEAIRDTGAEDTITKEGLIDYVKEGELAGLTAILRQKEELGELRDSLSE